MLGMMVGVVCLVTWGALRNADPQEESGSSERVRVARALVLLLVGVGTAVLSLGTTAILP